MKTVFFVGEGVFIALILYFIFTQLMLPALRGTSLFPYFRKEGKIREEIVDLNQEKHEAELRDELEQRRREWFGTTTKEATDAAEATAASGVPQVTQPKDPK